MRRGFLAATILLLGAASPRAFAGDIGLFPYDPQGKIKAVRAIDTNGDGMADLVLIVERREEGAAPTMEIQILRTPKEPAGKAYYGEQDVTRIPCVGPTAMGLANAGAIAVGRFGPKGAFRLRVLAPSGVEDRDGAGTITEGTRGVPLPKPLLARSAGAALVFWDSVVDLDGDGIDECWYPTADGNMTVGGLAYLDEAQRTDAVLFGRKTTVPSLMPADIDGDGRKELIGLEGTDLVVWRLGANGQLTRGDRVPLPFLVPDPTRPVNELHAPRLSLADVDGDKKTDLLVTLIQGRADKPGGLKTSLYHYPGPFFDPTTHELVQPSIRIDTESVALHPKFVDIDGDGKLDYVADSIRGTVVDLVKRIMGAEPVITYTAFRFIPAKGTFEPEPYATVTTPYSSAIARSGTFDRSGFFEGDFDGDGVKDLLDLGNMSAVTIFKGTRSEGAFEAPILKPVACPAKESFAPDCVISDLNGDGRADAAIWSEKHLFLIVSKGAK